MILFIDYNFMKNKYISSHIKTNLKYHIIFSTKYRRKCLNQIHDIVIDAFKHCEYISHFKILNINLAENHIHLLITFSPQYSIEQTVKRLKQVTTNYIYDKCEEYLKQYYYKKKKYYGPEDIFVQLLKKYKDLKKQKIRRDIKISPNSFYVSNYLTSLYSQEFHQKPQYLLLQHLRVPQLLHALQLRIQISLEDPLLHALQ